MISEEANRFKNEILNSDLKEKLSLKNEIDNDNILVGSCPLCFGPYFRVDPTAKTWQCFSCGKGYVVKNLDDIASIRENPYLRKSYNHHQFERDTNSVL